MTSCTLVRTTSSDTYGSQWPAYLYSSLWKAKPLLYNWREFTDTFSFLSQHILCAGSKNNNLCSRGGHTHLHTTVPIFSKLLCQKGIQLGFKYTVCYKLVKRGITYLHVQVSSSRTHLPSIHMHVYTLHKHCGCGCKWINTFRFLLVWVAMIEKWRAPRGQYFTHAQCKLIYCALNRMKSVFWSGVEQHRINPWKIE